MRLPFTGLFVFCLAAVASAQVYLKPTEGAFEALREKSVKVESTIDRGFASTTLTLVFANQSSSRIEADFVYTLRPGMLATGFAYWYGDEKVVARIVEKERAAEIYKHITTRMHDPALVELIGKRTFRARIFPVMPNDDLKVEIKLVQPLSKGVTYEVPLKLPKGQLLDSLDVQLQVKYPAGTQLATSIPMKHAGQNYTFHAENYRPDHDLRATVRLAPSPIRTALFAAPDGGKDGFFALSISGLELSQATLTASVVKLYDVNPRRTARLTTNHESVIVGRYVGSGSTELTLKDAKRRQTKLGTFTFPSTREPDNLAGKLWAAAKLEAMPAKPLKPMLNLSSRFGLPSKVTSWLAIPETERERYHEEKTQADFEMLTRNYVRARIDGFSGDPEMTTLKTFATSHLRDQEDIRNAIANTVEALGARDGKLVFDERLVGRWNSYIARAALNRLQRVGKAFGKKDFAEEQIQNVGEDGVRIAYSRLASALARKRFDEKEIQKLWREFNRNASAAGLDAGDRKELMKSQGLPFGSLLNRIADEISEGRPSSEAAMEAWEQARREANFLGLEIRSEKNRALRTLADEIGGRWASEIQNIHRDSKEIKDLKEQISRLASAGGFRVSEVESKAMKSAFAQDRLRERFRYIEALRNHDSREELAKRRLALIKADGEYWGVQSDAEFYQKKAGTHADRVEIKVELESLHTLPVTNEVKARIKVLESKEAELRAQYGDPLTTSDAPEDATLVVAKMPDGTIKPLAWNPANRRWEAKFEIPSYQKEGRYGIEVTIVLRDGSRRTETFHYTVDLTPPKGKVKLILMGQQLRIVLECSEDVARAQAVLPSGKTILLSEVKPGLFASTVLAPQMSSFSVRLVLTDRAHNVSEVVGKCGG